MPTAVEPTPSSPGQARAARIRHLSVLVQRASAELADLIAKEQRINNVRQGLKVPGTVAPSTAPAPRVRQWAEEQGLILRGRRGRVSDAVRCAYAEAGEPYGA